ncbi:MAG TPA: triphosphoribosyl-dephospho-CoA synthase [Albitalea sp.]
MNTPQAIRTAFVWACELDVAARKPGNVSRASPGHGMTADQFVASAAAAAQPLAQAGRPVGARIEAAVRATLAVAGCNTNLGIVLLCAPLAAACERWRPADGAAGLREALGAELAALDVEDARGAYAAIALARPGGLGRVAAHDVAEPPRLALGEAMALAAHRDRIAWQYGHAHADVFERALPAFEAARAPLRDPAAAATRAMQCAYLELLAAHPDSHIVRKHGEAAAQCVMAEAAPWRERARRGDVPDDDPAFAAWDASLKARALNPGTTADLCVATAFVAALCTPRAAAR